MYLLLKNGVFMCFFHCHLRFFRHLYTVSLPPSWPPIPRLRIDRNVDHVPRCCRPFPRSKLNPLKIRFSAIMGVFCSLQMWEVDLNQNELRGCWSLKKKNQSWNMSSNGTQVQSSPSRFRKHILPAIGFEGCICYIYWCDVGFPEILNYWFKR